MADNIDGLELEPKIAIPTGISVGLSMASLPTQSKDWLPEPWNIFEHAINMGLSSVIGAATGAIAASAYLAYSEKRGNFYQSRMRAVMSAAAFAVGLTANATAETKVGASIFNSTPDFLDATYGVVFATISGAVVIRVKKASVK